MPRQVHWLWQNARGGWTFAGSFPEMYIGPERHRPGHKTGGLSETESFPKVQTGEVYDSTGETQCLGVSPEYT